MSAEPDAEATLPDATAGAPGARLRRAARQTWLLAAREYSVAVRSHALTGVALLFGLFSVAMVALGTSAVGPTRLAAVLASLLQLAVYLVPLAGLAVGYDLVVGAAERGSLETVLTLPVSPARVVVGRFLGRAAGLAAAMLLGFAAGGAYLVGIAGPSSLGGYATVVLPAVAAGVTFLGLGTLASAVAGEKTHALGGALLAWVWFVLLHDLAALGLVAALSLSERAVAVAVLLNPADVFRVLVLRGLPTGAGGLAAVLNATPLSAPLLVAALLVWATVPVGAAAVLVGRRRI